VTITLSEIHYDRFPLLLSQAALYDLREQTESAMVHAGSFEIAAKRGAGWSNRKRIKRLWLP